VRTALNKLKSTNEITSKATNRYTLIEVVNYGLYQDDNKQNNKQNNEQDNKRITNEQQTDNKRITTSKQYNNITTPTPPPFRHSFINSSPQLPPPEVSGVFKKTFLGGGESEGVDPVDGEWLTVGDVMQELEDDTVRTKAKHNAPGWHLRDLAEVYVKGIHDGKRARPRSVRAAFPAWCLRYTKGKPPDCT
jgi:hypothetical protein